MEGTARFGLFFTDDSHVTMVDPKRREYTVRFGSSGKDDGVTLEMSNTQLFGLVVNAMQELAHNEEGVLDTLMHRITVMKESDPLVLQPTA